MVKLVASRIAAIRLVWIIVVLLIPIVIMGFFIVRGIQEELFFNQREQSGITFLGVLSPAMLDAAEGKTKATSYDILLTKGPKFAIAADQEAAFEKLHRSLYSSPIDPVLVLRLTHDLILHVGESSNIILDPFADTYYLGNATAQGMPDLILRYRQLQYAARKANESYDNKNLALVASADGALHESVETLWSQVNAAKTAGRNSYEYIPILADFDLISKSHINRTRDLLAGFGNEHGATMAMLQNLTSSSSEVLALYRDIWDKINTRYTALKNKRAEVLNKKLTFVLVASLLSILVGLGSAITMFTSSLRRLDDISQAHLDAEQAQREAESMAQKLIVINGDMMGVNKELGHQMHMLKEAQDALVNKGRMEQLGQLTATIAHELRNPLGAVRTSAFLIERKIKGKQLGFEPQLERINNGVSRCDNIITQLLDFSRTKPLASRPSDLDNWLAKTIEEEAKQLPSAVSIECDLNLQERLVPFDPSRMQRAVINLLTNASEAMVGKGDDPSKFENSSPTMRITTELIGEQAVIRFKDNGPGISVENLTKIREPLFTTKSFGTGLGLPAVDQIVKQHHGHMEVSSQLGHGAEFTIFLPLTTTQEIAA